MAHSSSDNCGIGLVIYVMKLCILPLEWSAEHCSSARPSQCRVVDDTVMFCPLFCRNFRKRRWSNVVQCWNESASNLIYLQWKGFTAQCLLMKNAVKHLRFIRSWVHNFLAYSYCSGFRAVHISAALGCHTCQFFPMLIPKVKSSASFTFRNSSSQAVVPYKLL
jgi:hypothetical protein